MSDSDRLDRETHEWALVNQTLLVDIVHDIQTCSEEKGPDGTCDCVRSIARHLYRFETQAKSRTKERDEARAQLAVATARVAVLEATLRCLRHIDTDRELSCHEQIDAVLRHPDPLAAAALRVVMAADELTTYLEHGEMSEVAKLTKSLMTAVGDFRALAPGGLRETVRRTFDRSS